MPKVKLKKDSPPFKTISQVANIMGVETHVLRFWEKEFSQIAPQRSNGRRYYDKEAVDTILKIRALLYEQGLTIEGAKKHLKYRDSEITTSNTSVILQELHKLEKILLS